MSSLNVEALHRELFYNGTPYIRSRTQINRRTSARIAGAVLPRNCHGNAGRAGG
jgi:hypothetical protein